MYVSESLQKLKPKYIEINSTRKHDFNEIIFALALFTTFFIGCINKFFPTFSLIETAEEWNLHRRLIQPTFHVSTLEQFLGTFIDASNVLVQRFKEGSSQLNVTHLVNQCVIDILNGTQRDAFKFSSSQMRLIFNGSFNFRLFFPITSRICSRCPNFNEQRHQYG